MARVYAHRRDDSIYGLIRRVLAKRPEHCWAVDEIWPWMLGVSRQELVEKLHKLAVRRQIVRVEIPGERFARWQA